MRAARRRGEMILIRRAAQFSGRAREGWLGGQSSPWKNPGEDSRYDMMTFMRFMEWTVLHEAARRSFSRTLAKFDPSPTSKPVAILTAWRGELPDSSGMPQPEGVRRKLNDEANLRLAANVRRRGLSLVPVLGAGQEEGEDGLITANREESYIVQPVGEMGEKEFVAHIKNLLYNPTGEQERGPYTHTQWGGVVKLPSQPRAFVVHNHGNPTGPEDYRIGDHLGTSARPRSSEPYYTQLKYGPRASDSMTDPLDKPDDLGTIKGRPGRRFTLGGGS